MIIGAVIVFNWKIIRKQTLILKLYDHRLSLDAPLDGGPNWSGHIRVLPFTPPNITNGLNIDGDWDTDETVLSVANQWFDDYSNSLCMPSAPLRVGTRVSAGAKMKRIWYIVSDDGVPHTVCVLYHSLSTGLRRRVILVADWPRSSQSN